MASSNTGFRHRYNSGSMTMFPQPKANSSSPKRLAAEPRPPHLAFLVTLKTIIYN